MLVKEIIDLLRSKMAVGLDGPAAGRISCLAYHSSKTEPGCLFAALPGTKDDGAVYVGEAVGRGAAVILHAESARESLRAFSGKTVLLSVQDVRLALALVAHAFHGRPSERMTMMAVTGTNGKTTFTYLVEAMARAAGMPCGVIGTIEYRLGNRSVPAERTTPEAPDLAEVLAWMADGGARMVAMEVSSHALAQRRVDGTRFDYGVFTNLSQDHLDFHQDMESYYQAKRRLFTEFDLKASIINLDDPWGRRLAGETAGEIITYGTLPECHIRPRELHFGPHGLKMDLEVPGSLFHLAAHLLGAHNAQNIMAAAAAGWRLGLPAEAIREGLASMREVPGRFQRISRPGEPLVIVDYAHTPDALEKLLVGARQITTGRLILVFGCGGDRDRGKRPLMGGIAAVKSDRTVITSDNPRSENPGAIITAVEEGYLKERPDGYTVIPDRREAIAEAIRGAAPQDTVIIAGKGHEDYQILGQKKVHFDDREVAREVLETLRVNR